MGATDEKIKLRCTIHVQDPLLVSFLNQLVDYVPAGPDHTAGRRFSSRFGIIGRTWRTGNAYLVGKWLPESAPRITEASDSPEFRTKLVQYMADNWGMTGSEAQRASHKPSYLALPIKSGKDNVPVGLLFMDAEVEDAFGTDNGNLPKFDDALRDSEIPEKLAALKEDIKKYASSLDLEKLTDA
jgi:hypothetical protein